jgi:hypothetical protein
MKSKVVKQTEAPKLTLADLNKAKSKFSGGSSFGNKGPVTKYTPKTFRITQHKGG